MGIKVKGIDRCIKSFDKTINRTKDNAVRAMHASMTVASTQAAIYTPIDTSTLINSQYREVVINGTRITGRVGYTANYAAYVADPSIKMKFKRPTAKKDFLNEGFKDVEAEILDIFKRELFR